MYLPKKVNVMRTNTLNTGIEWCNEAFKHADVIIYNKDNFFKSYVDIAARVACFTLIVPFATALIGERLIVKPDTPNIGYTTKSINYSQTT